MLDATGAFKSDRSALTVLNRAFECADQHGRSARGNLDTLEVVADAFIQCQRRGVAERISAESGSADFLGVKRSWDETACRMYTKNAPHLDKLVAKLNIDRQFLKIYDKKRFGVVFQVMQQRCAISKDGTYDPIYLPAKILAEQSASNIAHAVESSLPELSSSSLQALARDTYEWLFLQLMGDHVAANRLSHTILAHRMGDVVIDDARCAMHQNHLGFLGTVRPWSLTGPMYSLNTGLQNAGNQTKLIGAVCVQARRARIIYGRPPPEEAVAYSRWLFDITIGRFSNLDMVESEIEKEKVQRRIAELRSSLEATVNGRFWLNRIEHYCYDPITGGPCCDNEEHAHNKIAGALQGVVAFLIDSRNCASDHDWFKTVHAGKGFAFGCSCHNFLTNALRTVCPLTDVDTDAALAECPGDDRGVFFAKRLKRGVKKLCEPSAPQKLLTMMAVTPELESFAFFLLEEARDERLKNSTNPNGTKSILRRVIENDRAKLKEVQVGLAGLLDDNGGLNMLWRHVREHDPVPVQAKYRLARGALLRASGQFNARFDEHFDGFPYDWVLAQEKNEAGQDVIVDNFMKKRRCCSRPFFCRRVRRKIDKMTTAEHKPTPQQTFRSKGFQNMVNFWCDSAESVTSIRNEHQHSSFGKKLRSGKAGGGAHGSAKRVSLADLLSHVKRDHETQFGPASSRAVPRKRLRRNAKSQLRKAELAIRRARRRNPGKVAVTEFKLGCGRTPELQHINKCLKAFKQDRRDQRIKGKIPMTEYKGLRAQWKQDFAASPALQALCEQEVKSARAARAQRVQDAQTRKALNMPPLREDAPPPVYGPDVSAVDSITLWEAGCLNSPVSPSVLRKHVGDVPALSVFAKSLRENAELSAAHNVYVTDALPNYEKKKMSKWRSSIRSCMERHPGVCIHEAGNLYRAVLAMHKQMLARLGFTIEGQTPSCAHDKAGEAVFRFTSEPTPEQPAKIVKWFILSYYSGNPRRCSFVELVRRAGGDDVFQVRAGEDGKLKHVSGHALSLDLLRRHCTVWSMAEVAYEDVSVALVHTLAVQHEATWPKQKTKYTA